MKLYRFYGEIEDDPANYEVHGIVAAPNKVEARRVAKRASIDTYNGEAGGWSSKPKLIWLDVAAVVIPDQPGVVTSGGSYSR